MLFSCTKLALSTAAPKPMTSRIKRCRMICEAAVCGLETSFVVQQRSSQTQEERVPLIFIDVKGLQSSEQSDLAIYLLYMA